MIQSARDRRIPKIPKVVLRTISRARRPLRYCRAMIGALFRSVVLCATVCLSGALVSCGSAGNGTKSNPPGGNVIGTYSNSSGSFALDLRSGGAATYTSVGATFPCTYTVAGDKLTLSCQGQTAHTVFTVQKDGSLAGPSDSTIPTLRKTT